jgi:hypothetical protein
MLGDNANPYEIVSKSRRVRSFPTRDVLFDMVRSFCDFMIQIVLVGDDRGAAWKIKVLCEP